MKIQMLNNNILCKDNIDTFEKKDGIYIPKASKDYKSLEVVQAEDIETGSEIYIKNHLGTSIEIEGEKYIVIDKHDIILVV